MKKVNYLIDFIFFVLAIYLLESKPETPMYKIDFPTVNQNLEVLSDSIDTAESSNSTIKINNEARIVWA